MLLLKTFSPSFKHVVRIIIQHNPDLVIEVKPKEWVIINVSHPIEHILHHTWVHLLIIQ